MRGRKWSRKFGGSVGSEVSQHVHRPEHGVSLDKVKILTVDNRTIERGVKEAIYIRVMDPRLNTDAGLYLLPAVWTNLLTSRVRAPPPCPRTPFEVEAHHMVPQRHRNTNST